MYLKTRFCQGQLRSVFNRPFDCQIPVHVHRFQCMITGGPYCCVVNSGKFYGLWYMGFFYDKNVF